MRWIPNAIQVATAAVLFYFIARWSFEGLWTLSAPLYGLGDFARSQTVLGIGRLFALSTDALMRVAAFIATIKLAVAIVFAIHIVERVRAHFGRKLDYEILEAGLILATLLIVMIVAPPLFESDAAQIRIDGLHLLLLAVVAMLVAVERIADLAAPPPRRAPRVMREPAYSAPPVGDSHVVPLPRHGAPAPPRLASERKSDGPGKA